MDINTQTIVPQTTTQPTSSPPPVNEQEVQAQEAELNTDSTVNISTEAQKASSTTETPTGTILGNEDEAQEAANQFATDAANDPVLTQEVQSSSLTSNEVGRLLGGQ